MAKRTDGKSKLTLEMRQRLAEAARETRRLIYGERGVPEWGTAFAEIECDAKEVGHELIRLLMEQTSGGQAETIPQSALVTANGEVAQAAGLEERQIETESGPVNWFEPKVYLPKSRKAFFPSGEGSGARG